MFDQGISTDCAVEDSAINEGNKLWQDELPSISWSDFNDIDASIWQEEKAIDSVICVMQILSLLYFFYTKHASCRKEKEFTYRTGLRTYIFNFLVISCIFQLSTFALHFERIRLLMESDVLHMRVFRILYFLWFIHVFAGLYKTSSAQQRKREQTEALALLREKKAEMIRQHHDLMMKKQLKLAYLRLSNDSQSNKKYEKLSVEPLPMNEPPKNPMCNKFNNHTEKKNTNKKRTMSRRSVRRYRMFV